VQLVRAVDDMNAAHWAAAQRDLAAAHGGAAEDLLGAVLAVWVNAAQGRYSAINDDLRPLLGVRPYGSLLNAQQAMVYDLAGRSDDALHAYAQDDGALWSAPTVVRRADLMLRNGSRDTAQALLEAGVNAGNPEIEAALARVRAGQPPALAPLTPTRGAAVGLYGVATIYLQQSDSADGLAALTLAQMLDPDLDAAKVAISSQQQRLQHPDLAMQALQAIAPTSAYAVGARVMQAWILYDQGQGDAAVALAQQAAAGGDARAQRALGDLYRALKRYRDAEAVYDTLIAAYPNDWRLYYARGATRAHLNRDDDSEADLQHALSLSPDQPEVLNYLAYAWVDRGVRLPEALAMLQRAAALRPDSGAIIDSLGWAYYRMGDYPHAEEALERAVQLEPGDATLNEHLGDLYWRVGRRTEARFQWTHALAGSPDDADALHDKLEHGLPPPPARR